MRVRAGAASIVALGFVFVPIGGRAEPITDQLTRADYPTTFGTMSGTVNFEQVGSHSLGARGNNAAMAVAGECIYVGNRGFDREKVLVIDAANPATPGLAGVIADTGVQGSTTRELRAVPSQHMLLVLTYAQSVGVYRRAPGPSDDPGPNAILRYDISDCRHPVFAGAYDLGTLRPHEMFVWEDHNVSRPPRALAYITTPFGPVQLVVADMTMTRAPATVTVWDGLYPQPLAAETENSALGSYLHSLSVSEDGRTGYLAYWDAGYYEIDTSQVADGFPAPVIVSVTPAEQAAGRGVSYTFRPSSGDGDPARRLNKGNTHSAVPVPGRPLVALTDEAYDGIGECPYGWFHLLDTSDMLGPRVASEYRLSNQTPEWCDAHKTADSGLGAHDSNHGGTWSSHNLTLTEDLAIVAWHAGGLQAIDISDPARPAQAGQFAPAPLPTVRRPAELGEYLGPYPVLMWSYPIFKDGLVYVLDIRNGLFILRYTGPHAEEITGFREGNSNVRDATIVPGVSAPATVTFSGLRGTAVSSAQFCLLP
jgi:hypothetical protein